MDQSRGLVDKLIAINLRNRFIQMAEDSKAILQNHIGSRLMWSTTDDFLIWSHLREHGRPVLSLFHYGIGCGYRSPVRGAPPGSSTWIFDGWDPSVAGSHSFAGRSDPKWLEQKENERGEERQRELRLYLDLSAIHAPLPHLIRGSPSTWVHSCWWRCCWENYRLSNGVNGSGHFRRLGIQK